MAKLIFFIHGVAVRNSNHAAPLPELIKDALNKRHKELPYMRQIFWGNFLGETEKTWTLIDRDFAKQKQKKSDFDQHQSFKYQSIRRGSLSQFVGDIFNYLNTDTGQQIRRTIYNEIDQALSRYSDVQDIYFVAHSLGTVILWDILFSNRFEPDDPALEIRKLLISRVSLQGIVTMGSPIIFVNMTLGITSCDVENSFCRYAKPGKLTPWLNFLHASDLIACPLNPLLQQVDPSLINMEDVYLTRQLDSPEQTIKNITESGPVKLVTDRMPELSDSISSLPGIVGTPAAHLSYFEDPLLVSRIATMIHPHDVRELAQNTLKKVISHLNRVPGMTKIKSETRREIAWQLNFTDEVLSQFNLKSNCGSIKLTRNIIQVHHVIVTDQRENVKFFGYVGLIHGEGLCQAVRNIQAEFGLR